MKGRVYREEGEGAGESNVMVQGGDRKIGLFNGWRHCCCC